MPLQHRARPLPHTPHLPLPRQPIPIRRHCHRVPVLEPHIGAFEVCEERGMGVGGGVGGVAEGRAFFNAVVYEVALES